MKDEVGAATMAQLRNDKAALDKAQSQGKMLGKIFGMAGGCCTCMPFHLKKVRSENRA